MDFKARRDQQIVSLTYCLTRAIVFHQLILQLDKSLSFLNSGGLDLEISGDELNASVNSLSSGSLFLVVLNLFGLYLTPLYTASVSFFLVVVFVLLIFSCIIGGPHYLLFSLCESCL